MRKQGAKGRRMISLLRPRTPVGRVLLAATAALWAAVLIVAWAPGPDAQSIDGATEAQPGPSAWLALATVVVVVVAGALHACRHR